MGDRMTCGTGLLTGVLTLAGGLRPALPEGGALVYDRSFTRELEAAAAFTEMGVTKRFFFAEKTVGRKGWNMKLKMSKRAGAALVVLSSLLAGCLVQPEKPRNVLVPGWKQSEMLVMSFNLKGERSAAALEGLAATIAEAKPRYVALQDLTKAQSDDLAKRLGMRGDYCASGRNDAGVAVLSRNERVMGVFTVQTALKLPRSVDNSPKVTPRAALSVQFAEHEVASIWLDGAVSADDRVEFLKLAKGVCNNHRPAVMAMDLGVKRGAGDVWPLYGQLFRTVSPADDDSGNCIATCWNFASQFGLDRNCRIPVKGFPGCYAVMANIKY